MKKKAPAAAKRVSATRKKTAAVKKMAVEIPTPAAAKKPRPAKTAPPIHESKPDKLAEKAFPMVAIIAEQVRSSIPPELVTKVKQTTSKRLTVSDAYPYETMMKKVDYEREIALLQIELVKMQTWVNQSGEKIVMIFEGRDAAGKGGTIKRFTENLNPRVASIVALAKPTDEERGQWYFQRYVRHMPTKGEIRFLTVPGIIEPVSNM